MKAVMYHYVRPGCATLPYFRYLHAEDFAQQLDWMDESFGFVSREAFENAIDTHEPVNGVVLTFDDGVRDHYDHVFPELKRRGLWGIFYVPTGVYQRQVLLDVHRTHLLLGRHGGASVLEALKGSVHDHMLIDKDNTAFRTNTYRFQDNDEATTEVKRILNYYISYQNRSEVLGELFGDMFGDERAVFEQSYLDLDQLREMAQAGMVIGSHSVSHPVFSKLGRDEQWREIDESFSFLEDITSSRIETFCYPYGGFHNFTDETQDLLKQRGCRFAFNVEPRDIDARDLVEFPMALPRYDCNMLRHGRASKGLTRPVESATL